jgi:hypothetical protein
MEDGRRLPGFYDTVCGEFPGRQGAVRSKLSGDAVKQWFLAVKKRAVGGLKE